MHIVPSKDVQGVTRRILKNEDGIEVSLGLKLRENILLKLKIFNMDTENIPDKGVLKPCILNKNICIAELVTGSSTLDVLLINANRKPVVLKVSSE